MSRKKLNPTEAELRNSAHDWLHVMADEFGVSPDIIPEGWVTVQDICKIKNITTGEAEGFVRRAVDAGKMEKKQFRVKSGGAGLKKVFHYYKK
jgi:hypothetical protein